MTTQKRKRLAIFVSFTGRGGVERVILNLLQGMSAHEVDVDLLLVVGKRGFLPEIPWPNVRLIELKAKHSHSALFPLIKYLKRERPDVLMAAKDRPIRTAVLARWLSGVKATRVAGQLHTSILGFLEKKSAWQKWQRCAPMRWFFPKLDQIIGVSQGLVDETVKITGLPRSRMSALPNPVLTPDIYARSLEPVAHPWANDPTVPYILGAGRLDPQKDFPTLLRAFDRVRREFPCRLIIIGEGPLQAELETMIAQLGLQDCAALAGYTDNPFAWMKRAALFAFSSVYEGSGNVLIEAMALGVPVVSTDCPHGPAETLQGGKLGKLVPVRDDERLAAAILETLRHPLTAAELQAAVQPFTVENSTRRYLEVLGLLPKQGSV